MSEPEFIAPPDTPLGLLQRGRGDGYRRMLLAPRAEAQALLIQCITHDPRLDSQIEDREEYYAALAVEVDLPLEPLVNHLRERDDPTQFTSATSLTVTTLTELARRGYRNAQDILCDYASWGQWWDWPLHDLLSIPETDLAPRLARAIEQRFPTDEALDEAVAWGQLGLLGEASPRIRDALQRRGPEPARGADGLPDLTSLSPGEILDLVDGGNYRVLGKAIAERVASSDIDLLVSKVSLDRPFISHAALAGLTKLAPPDLSGWLADLWLAIPGRRSTSTERSRVRGWLLFDQAVSRATIALPAAITLPLARAWIGDPDRRKQELAERLLKNHATIEDLPVLRAALVPLLAGGDAESECCMITAFHHLPEIGLIPELNDIYRQFRYSQGRYYASKAIQVIAPDYFEQNLATECLWDCEEATRELAAKFAPWDDLEARLRIEAMAADRHEAEVCRQAAAERIRSQQTASPAAMK